MPWLYTILFHNKLKTQYFAGKFTFSEAKCTQEMYRAIDRVKKERDIC